MKKYIIKNLDCADCALKIENELNKMDSVRKCSLNFAASSLFIDTDNIEAVMRKIHDIEPGTTISEASAPAEKDGSVLKALLPVIISALLYLTGMLTASFVKNPYLSYIFFIPAYLVSGWRVLYSALRNIFKGRIFDENFLMTLATLGAIVLGDMEEAAGVMLFFIVGEFLQGLSLRKSRKSIQSLLALKPDFVNLITSDGIQQVDPQIVQIGSRIMVKPGERVPLDGKIVKGSSQVDTSALSGESVPGYFSENDTILAGMINKTHALEIEVVRLLAESSLMKIMELGENAAVKKAKTEKFITRFARYYTPVVVLCALGVALLTPLFFPSISFHDSIYRAFVLLVISCPCALVISIPLSYFIGIGNAAKEGILIKGSNFLDLLAKIKTVVFDKTGTLTEGVFKVKEIVAINGYNKEQLLEYAAIAESHSNHPIASSIIEHYGKPIPPVVFSHYEEVGGMGINAHYGDTIISAGNDKFLHNNEISHSDCFAEGTVLHLAINRVHAGYIIISDSIKAGSAHAIRQLKALGVQKTVMLTGDNEVSAKHVASELEIDAYYSNLLPGDKVSRLETLFADEKDRMIAVIGDGINDSPIITRADVGIAMGKTGSDAAIDAADVVLLSDNPDRLPEAIRIARKTKVVVWQNIVLAIGIKVVFIVLGATGHAGMWGAVFADMGVSLLAVLNAIRIHK